MSMDTKRIGRRKFLAALGAVGAMFGAGAERSVGAESAHTSTHSGRPLKLVCVYTPHGRAHELWQPREGFDIGFPDAVLAPFDDPATYKRSLKDRLLVLDGIDLSAGIAVGTSGHDGTRAILTGSGGDGKNASIDQYLAVDRDLGAETPFSTVVLGVGNDRSALDSNISYAAGGTPVPKWIDPAQTFTELFGAPLTGAKREEIAWQRRAGKSVLDAVRGDLARLRARAPAAEKTKLDQHQSALREMEKRLDTTERTCPASPPRPDAARFPKLHAYGGGEPYFDAITDLQIDLLAHALACDITRFATLFLGDLTRTHLFPELPIDVHTEVAHLYDASTDKRAGTPSTWHQLAVQNRYCYAKVARLLQRLDELGALDDTIVYVSGDMGDPARHSSRGVPTLLAGGCGGHFKMGRYLDLRASGGVPNNRILVSICQAFGVDTNRFGHATDPNIVTGRLDLLDA